MKSRHYVGLLMPEHQHTSKRAAARAIGYILRAAVALLCSYGVLRFLFDCFSVSVPSGFVFALCLGFTALFAVMLTSKIALAAGITLILSALAFVAHSLDGLRNASYLILTTLCNVWNLRLEELGFIVVTPQYTDISDELWFLSFTEDEMLLISAAVVILLVTAICSLLTIRRARAFLLLCIYIPIVATALFFGAVQGIFGLGLMLASIPAAVTLSVYDSTYCQKEAVSAILGAEKGSRSSRREQRHTRRTNASLGGYAGALSATIALIIVIPALCVNRPMTNLPLISYPVNKIQTYVNATLGDLGIVEMLPAPEAHVARPTTADERFTTGEKMFEISTDTRIPVYLRSWVGTDYRDDSWHTPDTDEIAYYHELFGDGFSHEFLTSELLAAVDPSLVDIAADSGITELFGYVNSYVHVEKKSPTDSLIFMPSYTDQRTRLLKYGTDSVASNVNYQNYCDGIFTSRQYILSDKYTTLARLSLTPSADIAQNLNRLMNHYAEQLVILSKMRELLLDGEDIDDVREYYAELAAENSLGEIKTVDGSYTFPTGEKSLSYRYAFEMSEAERLHVDALTDNITLYYSYVYDSYLGGCEGFAQFDALMRRICDKYGIDIREASYSDKHRYCAAVIDYLSKNMTYTLDPKSPTAGRHYSNAAETFLFDTNEGYCAQYASAAVMLLRAAGIPARYAEGYIADSFTMTGGKPGKYSSTVRDENAHAWVEVYFDYYGWVIYEVTTPYTSVTAPDTDTEDTTDTTAPEETTLPPDDTTEPADTTTAPDRPEVTTADKAPDTTEKSPVSETAKDSAPNSTNTYDTDSLGTLPPDTVPDTSKPYALVITVIAVLLLSAAAVTVIILRHRSKASKKRFSALINAARQEHPDARGRIDAARALGESIMRILAAEDLSPERGEQACDFGARVDTALKDKVSISFTDVMAAIGTAEFANDISAKETALLCSAAEELRALLTEKGGRVRRWLYKYFGVIS